jgi:5-methylcytosine-specific restriction endonuclease McrA
MTLSARQAKQVLSRLCVEFEDPNPLNVVDYIGLGGFKGKELLQGLTDYVSRHPDILGEVAFYKSDAWRRVRYAVLERDGARCVCCGRTPQKHGVIVHVDHVKPRSVEPKLELDPTNLQVLCEDCNLGKEADYSTDWRCT